VEVAVRCRRLLIVLIVPLLLGLAATAPAAAVPALVNYVALGDSYASGVGTGDYDPASGNCLRSPAAYPSLWATSREIDSFQFVACSGATTQDVIDQQLSALDQNTTLVTITVGGNDAGFASVITTCTIGTDKACLRAIEDAVVYINNQLPGRLAATYKLVRQRSPWAQVIVVGYPRLFDLTWLCYLGHNRRVRLNDAADQLNALISDRAAVAGFDFADVSTGFDGHGVCSADAWMHGLTYPVTESYHPTKTGQSDGYLPAVLALTG
jgi:lysophospholipase L1-like esterase